MKIAVCLSGLPRAVETCYPSIKKAILDPYQPDVFAHVWSMDIEGKDKHISYEDQVDKVAELYSPKEMQVGYLTNSKLKQYLDTTGLNDEECVGIYKDKRRHCLSMYYSILQANNLKIDFEMKNNMIYDQVFRLRTDISLRDLPIKFNNTIHIPQRSDTLTAGGYEDMVAWGPSRFMDYYSKLYNFFSKYEPICRNDSKTFWNAHVMLKMHLDRKTDLYPVTLIDNVDLRRRLR